ncbi:MAG: hypothetical protein IKB20_01220 [Clostridia bacterium]|nr:hypothetical protein [Clostridia bacterium]
MSAIRDMYEMRKGNYDSILQSEEYQKSLDEVIKCDDEMRKALKKNPKLLALYQKATSALDTLCVVGADDHYIEGFKFGVLMGLDIAGMR